MRWGIEAAIYALLKDGFSTAEIMRRMHVTKHQVQDVMNKMQKQANAG